MRLDVGKPPDPSSTLRARPASPRRLLNVLNSGPTWSRRPASACSPAVRKLSYTPNLRARRLRTRPRDTIVTSPPCRSRSPADARGWLHHGDRGCGCRARVGERHGAGAGAAALQRDAAVHDLHIDGALVVEPLRTMRRLRCCRAVACRSSASGDNREKHAVRRPASLSRSRSAARAFASSNPRARIALIVGAQVRYTHLETERAYRDFARVQRMDAIVRPVDEAGGEAAGDATALELSQPTPSSTRCSSRSTCSRLAPTRRWPNRAAPCRAISSSPPATTASTRANANPPLDRGQPPSRRRCSARRRASVRAHRRSHRAQVCGRPTRHAGATRFVGGSVVKGLVHQRLHT